MHDPRWAPSQAVRSLGVRLLQGCWDARMLLDGGQQDGFPHSVVLGAGKGRSHLVYKVLQTRASKSQISQSLRLLI